MFSLLDDFKKFVDIINNYQGEEVIDLTNYSFLGAATLLPLLGYMKQNNINNYIPNIRTADYCKRVLGKKPHTTTTLPFEELPKNMRENEFADFAENIRKRLLSNIYVEPQSFEFLVTEVLNNIYDHSNFQRAYTLSQQYPASNVTDICLFDDGISIPGNFEKAGFNFKDDAEAILGAINGTSTDIYETGFSGRGLNTSTQVATLGFKEHMLIASRRGICYVDEIGARLY
ncbi:hypothetical protein LJC03_05915, partial [Methanobrevibacter sp. OttesenSCG-928-I08]|nr:hypothetical protein [Methanobrevibacter sp. OttesenSCG-928-I08]